jgi:uncharacterized cupredoxin-like copper-binding protein
MAWIRLTLLWPALLILAAALAACGATPGEIVIKTDGMRFVRDEARVKAGQPVTLRVVNRDGYTHAFDIDEFDIHAPLAAGESKTFVFTPEQAGQYTFYCGSPGHQAAGMVGVLVVEP